MVIKALAFDTGGTVFDWHSGIVNAVKKIASRSQVEANWDEFANDWRRRTLQSILGMVDADSNMDEVHRLTLQQSIASFGLEVFDDSERHTLWRAWHGLSPWPDFAAPIEALRPRYPIVSFTMLPTRLVMDVSRRAGLRWDAILSCEMIGTYKPDPKAYATVARWLELDPDQILMVACHNFDLNAAKKAGFRTAFIRRPLEWGPSGPPDPLPNMPYDFVEDGFEELRARLTE